MDEKQDLFPAPPEIMPKPKPKTTEETQLEMLIKSSANRLLEAIKDYNAILTCTTHTTNMKQAAECIIAYFQTKPSDTFNPLTALLSGSRGG
jgi:hypothetical protein